MNNNPRIKEMIPIIIVIMETTFDSFLMLKPIIAAEIPKNSKLKPTIMDTTPAENIGNKIKIKPKMIKIIPADFSNAITIHLH